MTGASGFVGRPLCVELLREHHGVRAAIRSPSPLPEGVEAVTVGNIDGSTDWTNALSGMDVVIHLAARVHVMRDRAADPLTEFLKVNRDGTENLARQAARAGVKRLVYVSSIKVNGEETSGHRCFAELDRPAPKDPYGISKWQAEEALIRISQETPLEVVILRPPLVYGPGVKGNFISLLAAVDNGIPLPLAGATNERSLIYVGNLVSALIACATNAAAAGQTYLVSDGQDVSTAQLVQEIASALGCNARSFYLPPKILRSVAMIAGRSSQVDRLFGSLRVDDRKLRAQLDWSPPFTLEQGLRLTAAWYRGQRYG